MGAPLRVFLPRLLLPLLLLGGWWLWRSAWFPQAREIVWRLDQSQGRIQFLEIQLFNSKGELLKREEFYAESAAKDEVIQHVPLKAGDYLIRLFAQGQRTDPYRSYRGTLRVRGEERIVMSIGDLEPQASPTYSR